jgi:uncharacterized iron-regulated membrane protein
MDWLVDLHHNLWAGHTGRQVAGAFGLALLLSAATGLIVWLCGRPDLRTAFLIRLRSPQRAWRDWHRAVGLAAMLVLGLEAYTGLWLCFPDAMRATLTAFVPVPKDARPPRPGPADVRTPKASLAVVMASAIAAVPDGRVREIRLPEDYGNVQVRMWRPGDFRSLGNNVVTVSNVTGRVITVDLYARKTTPQRFVQAMAGLHYAEWGGTMATCIYVGGGIATLLLFATGIMVWLRTDVTKARRARAAA